MDAAFGSWSGLAPDFKSEIHFGDLAGVGFTEVRKIRIAWRARRRWKGLILSAPVEAFFGAPFAVGFELFLFRERAALRVLIEKFLEPGAGVGFDIL